MKPTLVPAAICFLLINNLQAADDFTVQTMKNLHDDVALSHDIYTAQQPAGLWESNCEWLQNPAIGVRFNTTHDERARDIFEIDTYNPMLVLKGQTYGGVNFGLSYSHNFTQEKPNGLWVRYLLKVDGDIDSFGGYVAKQFDFGLKIGAAYTYSSAEYRVDRIGQYSEDASAGFGSVGFARSFGAKRLGRNVFVDTSANFLYSAEPEIWDFVWLAKLGTALCDRFAVYGAFNLYHELDDISDRGVGMTILSAHGYRPYHDGTWGEAGGGFQAQLGRGFSLTTEATVPVIDEGNSSRNAFLIRADLTWRF